MRYEFILAERVPPVALAGFPELRESTAPVGAAGTVMFGEVVDAAHLHGILDRLQDFGFTLLELRCLPD